MTVVLGLLQAAPSPETVGPGFLGFLAIFGVALATVLLLRSMVGHLRKVRYSPDPAAQGGVGQTGAGQLAAEQTGAEQTGVEQTGAEQTGVAQAGTAQTRTSNAGQNTPETASSVQDTREDSPGRDR